MAHSIATNRIGGVAYIEACRHGSRDDVDRTGAGVDLTKCRHQARRRPRVGFDGDDPLRRCGERVVPKLHRCGPGVVGLASEGKRQAGLADDGLDNAEDRGDVSETASLGRRGPAHAFQHGSLLDVDLEVRCRGGVDQGVRNVVGVESEVADGLGQADAFAVGERKRLGTE